MYKGGSLRTLCPKRCGFLDLVGSMMWVFRYPFIHMDQGRVPRFRAWTTLKAGTVLAFPTMTYSEDPFARLKVFPQ